MNPQLPSVLAPVHAFVLSANPKPYLNQNVMMYFSDQTKTWWRIQVDEATQEGDFQGLIEQMDTAGNTISTVEQDAKDALSGAFTGTISVQTSVHPRTNYQKNNHCIAFTLSGTREALANNYDSRLFEAVAQDGRAITAETGVIQQNPHNTCVYGLITVGGNLPLLPFPPLHEIFHYFDSLGIPRGIIRWFTHCTNIDAWRQSRMQEIV